MINFKNLAENLIIVIVAALLGGLIGYTASTKANKQTVELLRPTIEQAIRKETTQISNSFKTEIRKLKTKNGTTDFVISPKLDNTIEEPQDTTSRVEEKKPEEKGFFGRLFGKKDKDKR